MTKNFLTKLFKICVYSAAVLTASMAVAGPTNHITLLKEMFDKVTIEKNDKAISLYYDKSFELYSNGKKMTYDEFLQMHQNVFKTAIQYKVRYDEATFIDQGDKVAGRIFITTIKPNEPPREIEVILIAQYKDNKLYRLWELTYPDWSKMKAFQIKGQ